MDGSDEDPAVSRSKVKTSGWVMEIRRSRVVEDFFEGMPIAMGREVDLREVAGRNVLEVDRLSITVDRCGWGRAGGDGQGCWQP